LLPGAGVGVAKPSECKQPADGATVCPENTEHCVFTADPLGGTQGSCGLTSQADCTAALASDTDGTNCRALKCAYRVIQRARARTCAAKDAAIACTQPDDGETTCPDKREHCIFSADPLGGTQGSCALQTQAVCSAALDVDSDGSACMAQKCSYTDTTLADGFDGRLYGNVNFQVGMPTSTDPKTLTVQAEEAATIAVSQTAGAELKIEAGGESIANSPAGGEAATLTLQTTASCTAKDASAVTCSQPAPDSTVCPDNLDDCRFVPDPNPSAVPQQGSCAVTAQSDCTSALLADYDGTRCMELKCTYTAVGAGQLQTRRSVCA